MIEAPGSIANWLQTMNPPVGNVWSFRIAFEQPLISQGSTIYNILFKEKTVTRSIQHSLVSIAPGMSMDTMISDMNQRGASGNRWIGPMYVGTSPQVNHAYVRSDTSTSYSYQAVAEFEGVKPLLDEIAEKGLKRMQYVGTVRANDANYRIYETSSAQVEPIEYSFEQAIGSETPEQVLDEINGKAANLDVYWGSTQLRAKIATDPPQIIRIYAKNLVSPVSMNWGVRFP